MDPNSPESRGLICLMRVAIAGVSLDLVFGSEAEGSSVSIGAKLSPSRHMPSNRPPPEESRDTESVSAKFKPMTQTVIEKCALQHAVKIWENYHQLPVLLEPEAVVPDGLSSLGTSFCMSAWPNSHPGGRLFKNIIERNTAKCTVQVKVRKF